MSQSRLPEYVKNAFQAAGFRLPTEQEPAVTPLVYDRHSPACHCLTNLLAKRFRHRQVDAVVTVDGRSTPAAELLAECLARMQGRPVRLIRVRFHRLPPSPDSVRGKGRLQINIIGTYDDIAGMNVLLFEHVIRPNSYLPHIGKEAAIAGANVLGTATYLTYKGVWDCFKRWMGTFAERPQAVLRVREAGQIVRHKVSQLLEMRRRLNEPLKLFKLGSCIVDRPAA